MNITSEKTQMENAFLAEIAANRQDLSLRLIYADWLEEWCGRDKDAEAIRKEVLALNSTNATTDSTPPLASLWPAPNDLADLSEHQREQYARATVRPFGLLVGGPGTGKTRILSSLVATLLREHRRVRVASPTGKAAVRCAQVLRERHIFNLRPTTIHQLLEVSRSGRDGNGWGFQRNATRPLEAEFLLIDETSMLDTDLAAALLTATHPGQHVLFFGDIGQLPPVGHGSPLRDLLAAGLPTGYLTEIRRNAGMIVQACDAIRKRQQFRVAVKFDREAGLNLVHLEAHDPAEQLDRLSTLLDRMLASGSFHTRDDVQVITAINDEKKSPLARTALNRWLQAKLNQPTESAPTVGGYRLGDKVICLRNHWTADEDYIANGDIGRVTEVDERAKTVTVEFPDPPRPDRLSFVTKETSEIAQRDFALGWAITGHKSQGCEWRCAITLIDVTPAARHVASREWWYTVLSRARELTVTIGRNNAMQWQARRPKLERRKTFLRELVLERERG